MVAHETPGVNLPVGLHAGFPKGRKVQLAVIIVAENRLAPVAAIRDACLAEAAISPAEADLSCCSFSGGGW